MDRILIGQKLEALRYCVARVAEKCPDRVDQLQTNADLQDIVVLNLTRCIQLCVDIASHVIAASTEVAPATMGEAMAKLSDIGIIDDETATHLRRAIGFRNIAVRNYEKVDWSIVHAICRKHLDDFRAFAAAVATLLDD